MFGADPLGPRDTIVLGGGRRKRHPRGAGPLRHLRTAILRRIDGTLQGIAAENRAVLRRDARQNRDLDELGERGAALEAKP